MKDLVIFDLDDTLVDTSHVYWLARSRFVDLMLSLGLGRAEEIVARFEEIDTDNMRTLGFASGRYLVTMLATYEELGRKGEPSGRVVDEIHIAADIVRSNMPEPIDGADHLITGLRKSLRLAVCTRGEPELQLRKIEHWGWTDRFEAIEVVASKTAETFRSLMSRLDSAPSRTWVVGDSVKSDINPGLAAGAKCVQVKYRHPEYNWIQEHDEEPICPIPVVDSLAQVSHLLQASFAE